MYVLASYFYLIVKLRKCSCSHTFGYKLMLTLGFSSLTLWSIFALREAVPCWWTQFLTV